MPTGKVLQMQDWSRELSGLLSPMNSQSLVRS